MPVEVRLSILWVTVLGLGYALPVHAAPALVLEPEDVVVVPVLEGGQCEIEVIKTGSAVLLSAGSLSCDQGMAPTDVALDANGHILVAVGSFSGQARIDRVDPADLSVTTVLRIADHPEISSLFELFFAFAIEPNGDLLFGGRGVGAVTALYRFEAASGQVHEVALFDGEQMIQDIAVVPQRQEALVVMSTWPNPRQLMRVDLTGVQLPEILSEHAGPRLAVGGSHACIVRNGTETLNVDTGATSALNPSVGDQFGLAIDTTGNCVTFDGNYQLAIVDAQTGQALTVPVQMPYHPRALAAVRAECSDGLDNDGDGLVDHGADPQCRHAADRGEGPNCSDGRDNDNDGKIDFGQDPDCASPNDDVEARPPCNASIASMTGPGPALLAFAAFLATLRRRR